MDESGNLGVLEAKFDSSAQFFLQHHRRGWPPGVRPCGHVFASGPCTHEKRCNAEPSILCGWFGMLPPRYASRWYAVVESLQHHRSRSPSGGVASARRRASAVLSCKAEICKRGWVSGLQFDAQHSCFAWSSTRGQKRDPEEVESRDKTGKSARQAPRRLALLRMMSWWLNLRPRITSVSVEDAQSGCMRNLDFMISPLCDPLREGGMPERFMASNACKVRKVFQVRWYPEGLRSNFGTR